MTSRETWVHIHMVRAGRIAALQWDQLAPPADDREAVMRRLCRSRGLEPSTSCGLRLADFQVLPVPVVECDSEGGEVD